MNRENLAGVCGLYCGACLVYQTMRKGDPGNIDTLLQEFKERGLGSTREDLECDGCLGQGKLTPFCGSCNIRVCAREKAGVTRCSDCPEFPCQLITDFNNDGMAHHAEVLDNIQNIREAGIRRWAELEEERWLCPRCHNPVSWYDTNCAECGAARSGRLFSLE